MNNFNAANNRVVWVDIPVADLERASGFYAKVLGIQVAQESFGEIRFAVLEHSVGNSGCLVIQPESIQREGGLLIYLNVDGRIQDAVAQVEACGGDVIQPTHAIGPHGFRALIHDSEGNRVALHSTSDA